MPVREGWSGLLPVAAHTGRHRWSGFREIEELPQIKNPTSGYVATANHNILPKQYPHDLGFDWSAPIASSELMKSWKAVESSASKTFSGCSTMRRLCRPENLSRC